MPGAEGVKQDDSFPESRDAEREKTSDKGKSVKDKNASAKAKDLSHVPCKFFRVGSCTAGSSCPFSHHALEPGQPKEPCAWFVKGNCKFGHKCALAHILPGQTMSMDRKNKKAAQAAANAANQTNASGSNPPSRDGQKNSRPQKNAAHGQGGGNARNPLLPGSTAPTRSLSSSRSPIPVQLKATLSPSAPAPPVKDTDFPSFGESNKLPSAPAQSKASSSDGASFTELPVPTPEGERKEFSPVDPDRTSPSPLPVSKPSTRRNGLSISPGVSELGPIGSPPRNSPGHPTRVNGFSPGTSPATGGIANSPFSAPGTQTSFMLQQNPSDDIKARSGLSASLGASVSWGAGRLQSSESRQGGSHALSNEVVVESDELEEFLPGSLTDLLTPDERSRRFSRNASTRPNMAAVLGDTGATALHPSGAEGHHPYSRSVPATSLLEEIRSIWANDNPGGLPGTPGTSVTSGLGNGTPSSFQSNSGLSTRVDEMLAPSNASAAFLPGLHHYMSSKTSATRSTGGMQSLYTHAGTGSHTPIGNTYQSGPSGMALSPPRPNPFIGRPAFEAVPSDSYLSQARLGGPGRGLDAFVADADRSALSPSTRALQSHAPGQSLPQGLAAGYSRIHALPPPVISSPSSSAAFSPGRSTGLSPAGKSFGHSSHPSGEWHNMSPNAATFLTHNEPQGQPSSSLPQVHQPEITNSTALGAPPGLGGLETMFSRLSYSAAAPRTSVAPPGAMARNPSGRGFGIQGPTSPLRRPVLTGDDDDVFSMDG